MRPSTKFALPLALAFLALQTGTALAHDGGGIAGGFVSGFSHPILGWDHVIAMVAVGLWGAVLGRPAVWILPLVFPLVMALGAAAGILGLPLPAVETGIALSGVVLGLMVALALPAPLWLAGVVTGVFAIFHGHAHGTELPQAAAPLAYGMGFVLATGLLHLGGIGFGLLWKGRVGQLAVRTAGLLIAAAGGAFLTGLA